MSHIFISHSEKDSEIALEIALNLEKVGYKTWCYELDSIPGPSYLVQTGRAIEQAESVILIISPHSIGSRQVTSEVVRAHESGKYFIPVLRDITHIEFQNRQPEWREAVGAATSIRIPPEGITGILTRIIAGLEALDIQPGARPDYTRIDRIAKLLNELRTSGVVQKVIEPKSEAPSSQIPTAKVDWIAKRLKTKPLISIVLGSITVILLIVFGSSLFDGPGDDNGPGSTPTPEAPYSPTPSVESKEVVTKITTSSFSAPGRRIQGITWDGKYLWLSDNSANIFKIDSSGKTLGACSSPDPTPEGLTWDGATFWIYTTNYGKIYQFTIDETGGVPETEIISSFKAPVRTIGGINDGLAWDGQHLWYSNLYNFYKLDTAGNVLTSLAFAHEIAGLAWDGTHLWLAYNSFPQNAVLVKTDTQGNELLSVQSPIYQIDALSWGDNHLWAAGTNELAGQQMIYKIELVTKAVTSQN